MAQRPARTEFQGPSPFGAHQRITPASFPGGLHCLGGPFFRELSLMLDPGGAVVQVDAPGYRAEELSAERRSGTLAFPPPPDDALDRLRRRYLGADRRAGRGIRNTSPDGEDEVFRRAGFLPAETVTVPDRRAVEQTADELVARVFSSSSTAPHLFGDRRDDYEADLREILARTSPAGRFYVRLPDNILRVWRLPA